MPFVEAALRAGIAQRTGRGGGAILLGLTLLGATAEAGPQATPPAATAGETSTLAACLAAVARGTEAEISCTYLALMTEEERTDLNRLTRGLLKDARCTVKVRIARPLVVAALTAADHVFEAPPQPVHCDIATKDASLPIEATFAPRVVFKDGKAVEATPGLAAVTGVNRYLAWPVVQYVNRAPGVRANMIAIINALRPQLAPPASR